MPASSGDFALFVGEAAHGFRLLADFESQQARGRFARAQLRPLQERCAFLSRARVGGSALAAAKRLSQGALLLEHGCGAFVSSGLAQALGACCHGGA
eukprot:6693465-Alexandrium_andersonii.AAC.1